MDTELHERISVRLKEMLNAWPMDIFGHILLRHLRKIHEHFIASSACVVVDNPSSVQTLQGDTVIITDSQLQIPKVFAGCVIIANRRPVHIQQLCCQHLLILGNERVTLGSSELEYLSVLGPKRLDLGHLKLGQTAVCLSNELYLDGSEISGGSQFLSVSQKLGVDGIQLDPQCKYLIGTRDPSDQLLRKYETLLAQHLKLVLVGYEDTTADHLLKFHLGTVKLVLDQVLTSIPRCNSELRPWELKGKIDAGHLVEYSHEQLLQYLAQQSPFQHFRSVTSSDPVSLDLSNSVWELLAHIRSRRPKKHQAS